MKKVKHLLLLLVLMVGFTTLAQADTCYTVVNVPVAKVRKIYETYTQKVPYTECKTVCVPVRDSCNRIIRYTSKKVCKTKYKYVTKKRFKGYEHIGYYNGQKVRLVWPTKLCTIPVRVPTDCCSAVVTNSCNSCVAN